MKLQTIDKATYRKHLNILIIAGVISLLFLSLAISQTAIFLFTDREGTHFWINVAGVAIALVMIGGLLNKYKHHEFMMEVYYVWQIKQQINYIIRKQKKLEAAVDQGNVNAMIVMRFYYEACTQLYNLDDNTITMSTLNKKSNELDQKINTTNVAVSAEQYEPEMLKSW